MNLRNRKGWAATAALALAATPALIALSGAPASAAPVTASGTLQCANSLVGQIAPFIISVTADPTSPVAPGATLDVDNAVVTLTVPGAVVGGFAQQAGATSVALNATTLKLDATHASGSLSATVTAASKPVTNYSATGGPGGTAIADDITFMVTGVDFGSVTVTGNDGQSVALSLAADSSSDVVALQAGLGLSFINCFNEDGGSHAGTWLATGVPWVPSLGSVNIVDPTPVVTPGAFNAVAAVTQTFQVTATDGGGSPISSWDVSTDPVCASGTATASISGTTGTATLTFTAPADATTCQIGITASDSSNTSDEEVFEITVVAGDNLSQDVTQVVNGGELTLSACGSSAAAPPACGITMDPAELDGTDLTTEGTIHQLTVTDARGLPLAWSLTAELAGDLVNTNAALSGDNAKISSDLLEITPTCGKAAGNTNAVPAHGAAATALGGPAVLCAATTGDNTGTFTADGDLELTVPSTTYAGTYTGTINFIVS